MDGRALIRETLKYLEKNENGQPKYRFDIYRNGLAQAGNRAISMLTSGLVSNVISEDDGPTPVSVYTISDIFNTVQQTTGDIMRDIQSLPGTLENIKVSLKELGYTAIDRTIDTLKSAIVPIEVVQTVNDVYRIVKPTVKKVKDIAQIMFYYPAAAEVAQDILSYLTRLAFSTAKNYLGKLFEIFMDTPVFAIYENDDAVNLSGTYSMLSDAANNALNDILSDDRTFGKIINYANSSINKTYEPSYNNLGISIPEDIVDVFHDYRTRKIFIASEHKIYELNEDYSTTVIYDDSSRVIEKIFYSNGALYYISSGSIYHLDELKATLTNPKIIFSDPIYLYSNNKLYNSSSFSELHTLKDDIAYSTFDFENNILYYISSSNKLYKLTNIDGTFFEEKILTFDNEDEINGMAYFNGMLYIIKSNYVTKVNVGLGFNSTQYSYANETGHHEGLVYTDGKLATNSSYFYSHNENNANILSNSIKALGSINCVTEKVYNNDKYYVATGGNKVFVTRASSNHSASWFSKELQNNTVNDDISGSSEASNIPDNMAGCLWYSDRNNDQYFVVNSQKNIYLINSTYFSDIFDVPPEKESEKLPYKEFVDFEDWFESDDTEPTPIIRITRKINVGDCVITAMKVIGDYVYVALFNPSYSESSQNILSVKTGIYKTVISKYDINIDYSNPVFEAEANNPKIYSFNYIDNNWYYTDGKKLYNITNPSITNLNLDDDRVLNILNNNEKIRLYTSQAVLDAVETKEYDKITSSVVYTAKSIASTKNVLMIADDDFVYNIVDNGKNSILNEMFQICYKKNANDFTLIQSCDSAFIVSKNSIKHVPFYDSITSFKYGCGYYTDTTPNKWYGAAPYYFASNVLNNNGKNAYSRNMFISSFKENFKVELEKLLKHIPDAFIAYISERLTESLQESGITIEGDDGQITKLLIDSVASTTANSIGMYVHDRFVEKIGDDNTYETFANNVYQACVADYTNNMTDDFYKIFEELYKSTINEALTSKNFGEEGISGYLLRYYQNHKAEWAKSMTDLIDIDTVDPDIYEVPLKSTNKKLKQTTYRFNYNTGKYEYEYMNSIPSDLSVAEGYLRDNQFYDEETGGSVIDQRTYNESDGTWSINDEVVCYKNPEDEKFYKFKLDDFIPTEDTTVVDEKTYYERTAENESYVLTSDTTEGNKPYYNPEYSKTNDTVPVSGKKYFTKSGGTEVYTLQPASEATLPDDVYFEKQEYQLTTDTEIGYVQVGGIKTIYLPYEEEVGEVTRYDVTFILDENGEYVDIEGVKYYNPTASGDKYSVSEVSEAENGTYYEYNVYEEEEIYNKVYYLPSYEQVTSEETIDSSKQYYKEEYVKTSDTSIDPNKTYYEYLDFDDYNNEVYYTYNPSASEKYKLEFTEIVDTYFNEYETYYINTGTELAPVYELAKELDLQYGPFYIITNVIRDDTNGEYEKKTMSGSQESGYKQVVTPVTDNLSRYFEVTYVKIQTPSSSDITAGEIYKLEYIQVENPNNTDISTYYEKEESFVVSRNLNYTENGEVVNDRKLYKMSNLDLVYTEVASPSGNPEQQGWYEISNYTEIIPGSSINPVEEGLYERNYSPEEYTKVSSPSGNPKTQGWYEFIGSYTNLYDDKKVYINLGAEEIASIFPVLDKAWHDKFYNRVKQAYDNLPDEPTKQDAIEALESVVFPEPDWNWKALINEAVTTLYIPTQGEQFKTIIRDSNMYPIQWQELPSRINRTAFDYALTTLLYMIKQGLLTNITILVDGGQVKCYSCVDASTVIQKIINRNYMIWRNQIRNAKREVEDSATNNFYYIFYDMIEAYDQTLYLLENILNQQSALYAKYIDMLIEEQVINDNDTEVSL